MQSERAFQKQPHIFVNQKTKRTKSTRVGKGGRRWYKDVGLGFKTPKTAIEGTYIGTASSIFIANCGYDDLSVNLQIKSVLSRAKSPSAAVSSLALSSQRKCIELLSFAANTFISSPNTPDMKNDTKTLRRMSHQRSVWRRVIRSRLGNAGL